MTSVQRPAFPAKAPNTTAKKCPACGGSHTRLVRKTLHHPSRLPTTVLVCRSCKYLWLEVPPA